MDGRPGGSVRWRRWPASGAAQPWTASLLLVAPFWAAREQMGGSGGCRWEGSCPPGPGGQPGCCPRSVLLLNDAMHGSTRVQFWHAWYRHLLPGACRTRKCRSSLFSPAAPFLPRHEHLCVALLCPPCVRRSGSATLRLSAVALACASEELGQLPVAAVPWRVNDCQTYADRQVRHCQNVSDRL